MIGQEWEHSPTVQNANIAKNYNIFFLYAVLYMYITAQNSCYQRDIVMQLSVNIDT